MAKAFVFLLLYYFLFSFHASCGILPKNEVENFLRSKEVTKTCWISPESLSDNYRPLVCQKFYVRIFNETQTLLLPNRKEPGCYAYESFSINKLSVTDITLVDIINQESVCALEKKDDEAYCLMSIRFNSKFNYKRKIRKFVKFKDKNPSVSFTLLLVEVD